MTTDSIKEKEVVLMTIKEPQTLSLVGSPANQIAFKIIRDDKESSMSAATPETPRVRRVRATRSEAPLLCLTFAEGTELADVESAQALYGLSDYTIGTDANGNYSLQRADITGIPEGCITVSLGGGKTAHISRSACASVDGAAGISLVAFEFSPEIFDGVEDVTQWLVRNDVDFLEGGVQNTDQSIVVKRAEFTADADVRRIEVESGVIAVISRAATGTLDIPATMIEVISETAYGNYGWGQLDFAASVADKEYTDESGDAIYTLSSVIRNILFYSDAPLSLKKELVSRATTQFAEYIGTLIDALPTALVVAVRSERNLKEKDMSAAPAAAPATPESATPVAAPAATPEFVTRQELLDTVTSAVTAAIAAAQTVARSDDTEEREEAPESSTGDLQQVSRSVGEMLEAIKTLGTRLERMESSTVVRSDSGDTTQAAAGSKDLFAGIFGGKK